MQKMESVTLTENMDWQGIGMKIPKSEAMQLAEFQSFHPEDADRLASQLDHLLVDFQVYQQNVRQFHWNRSLRPFLDLGPKFTLLNQVTENNINLVAEHLLEMGYHPEPSENLTALTYGRVAPLTLPFAEVNDALLALIESSQQLLVAVEEVWVLAQEVDEPHTLELMTNFIMQLRMAIHVFGSSRMAIYN